MIEIATALGITKGHAGNIMRRLVKYGLARRVKRGVYAPAEKQEAA